MNIKILIQNRSYLILSLVRIIFSVTNQAAAHGISHQVYPSEYAYHDDSVTRTESVSANCRRYPAGPFSQENYIHCDGTQLKLTDSNFGQEQYQSTDYYVWSSSSGEQLLFIFSTRVSLTTITLHYYSDSVQDLSRLIFYAVPDDFDVWDAPRTNYPRAVPPGGEPTGCRNVSIDVNFNTQKVLMYKHGSVSNFAVDEVQFFVCAVTTTSTSAMTHTSPQIASVNSTIFTESIRTDKGSNPFTNPVSMTNFTTDTMAEIVLSSGNTQGTTTTAVGVSIALLIILSTILMIIIITVVLTRSQCQRRRSTEQNLYTDSPLCILKLVANKYYMTPEFDHSFSLFFILFI